jgi:hypothetical protein
MEVSFCDEFEGGFGWIAHEFLRRTSHALVENGRVWLVDPVDAASVEERVRAAGEPAGVIQLLDRHTRDAPALAARLGVPHLELATGDSPFELVPLVGRRVWREAALWWAERRVLVCADALGTIGYFVAPGERLGVHPLLRLFPPRALSPLEPERVLVGHGEGVHDAAAAALREALATSRRRLAPALLRAARSSLRSR